MVVRVGNVNLGWDEKDGIHRRHHAAEGVHPDAGDRKVADDPHRARPHLDAARDVGRDAASDLLVQQRREPAVQRGPEDGENDQRRDRRQARSAARPQRPGDHAGKEAEIAAARLREQERERGERERRDVERPACRRRNAERELQRKEHHERACDRIRLESFGLPRNASYDRREVRGDAAKERHLVDPVRAEEADDREGGAGE